MMTNSKMSVFNRYTDPFTKKVTFKKHIIDKVFWDNAVNVYIPKDVNDLSNYVPPKSYNGSNWTLNNGDLMIKGEATESEVNGVKDLSAYEVFAITMVDDKDFGSSNMHHFEIRGK